MKFAALAAAYAGLAVLANWLASAYVVNPWPGYSAPAGVFAIGLILLLRDWLQCLRGLVWTMPLVYAAGLISWGIGEAAGWTSLRSIAIGSVVAFTVSETAEALVFTPLRRRRLVAGVLLGGIVGLALDSWIFLTIAFGSLDFFWGQCIGKLEMVVFGTALVYLRRNLAWTREPRLTGTTG